MANDQPVPSAPQGQDDAKNDAAHPDSNAVPEVKVPPSHASYSVACNKKRDKWDVAKLIAEFVGLGFLILYTLYTAGIYCANQKAAEAAQNTLGEIQKQTTLMRQQVIGTQAGIIQIPHQPRWDERLWQLGLEFPNVGVSNATILSSDVYAVRISLPKQTPIGDAIPLPIPHDTLKSGGQVNRQVQLPWPLPSGTFDDAHPWPGKEAVIIKGSITWNNSFDDKTDMFCYSFLPSWSIPSVSGWTVGGFQDNCDLVNRVKEIREIEKFAKEELRTGKRHQ